MKHNQKNEKRRLEIHSIFDVLGFGEGKSLRRVLIYNQD